MPEEENAKSKFDPSQFKWTVTDQRARNLAQIFKDFKSDKFLSDDIKSEKFSASQAEAVTKGLDAFCDEICMGKCGDRAIYRQIVFPE